MKMEPSDVAKLMYLPLCGAARDTTGCPLGRNVPTAVALLPVRASKCTVPELPSTANPWVGFSSPLGTPLAITPLGRKCTEVTLVSTAGMSKMRTISCTVQN